MRFAFRGGSDVFIQSRDLEPLDRYFSELHATFLDTLPPGCVIDGEIVIATRHGLDFDALRLRLHPAASRVARLAKDTPAEFVAFDLLLAAARERQASNTPDPDDARSDRRVRVALALRGSRS